MSGIKKKYCLTKESHTCTACHKSFKQKGGLRRHIVLAHYEDESFDHKNLKNYMKTSLPDFYRCVVCSKCYNDKQKLNIHMDIHILGDAELFCCCVCSKKFTCKEAFKLHCVDHGDSCCPCEICGKMYVSEANLKRHVINSHPTNSESVDQSSTKIRKRTSKSLQTDETAQVLYQCTLCPRTFQRKGSRINHIRAVHAIQKPILYV